MQPSIQVPDGHETAPCKLQGRRRRQSQIPGDSVSACWGV